MTNLAEKLETTPDVKNEITLPHGFFMRALKAAIPFAGKLDVRYYLNGLLFEIEKTGMNIVATDGHRLVKIPFSIPDIPASLIDQQFILCRSSIEDALKIIKPHKKADVFMTIKFPKPDTNIVVFESPNDKFELKIIDGRYPDYRRIIPNKIELKAEAVGINAAYLADLAKLKPVLSNYQGIKLQARGANESIVLTSVLPDNGKELLALIMPMRL